MASTKRKWKKEIQEQEDHFDVRTIVKEVHPTGLGGVSKMEEQKSPADARELFVITNRTFHPPLPVVDSIEGKAAFLLKRVKTAIADTELVGEAVYYHAVWNGWFNRYFICGLTGIGKRKISSSSHHVS